ncbi:alpha/beta fold hydrolase [Glutamicibacter sp.]|uniref:alpha/beta fold hydrolase n=1 Tax=Glutamicibacter sp. TaxID=1931995 RepID=UPI002B480432|nr:alpha/beta hydrolase [Glutamicibacter sp.]HJX79251.1 alpha/beta hydrolase [Glutamicibacter sp.]
MPPKTLNKLRGSDGSTVAYRRYGTGERVLTALHSLALDGSWYEPLAASLGAQYSILAPDFRGHGQSTQGHSPVSLALIAKDVAAMWAAEGVEHSVVLGISLGGMVAQAVSGSFPQMVDAQILMATRGAFDETAAQGTRARAAEVRAPQGLAQALEATMHRWFGDESANTRSPLVSQAREQWLQAGGDTIADYFEAMTQVGEFQLETPPPTLVVAGADDRSTARPVIEALAAQISGAELVVADGGHLVAFDNPAEVVRVIRPFLDGLDCWPR